MARRDEADASEQQRSHQADATEESDRKKRHKLVAGSRKGERDECESVCVCV